MALRETGLERVELTELQQKKLNALVKFWNDEKKRAFLEKRQEKDGCCLCDDVFMVIETPHPEEIDRVYGQLQGVLKQQKALIERQRALREKATKTLQGHASAYEGKPDLKVLPKTDDSPKKVDSSEKPKLTEAHQEKLRFIAKILKNPNNQKKLAKSKPALYNALVLAVKGKNPEQIDLAHERLEKLVNRKKTSQATPKKPQKATLPKKEEPESAVVNSAVAATEPPKEVSKGPSVKVSVVSEDTESKSGSGFAYLDGDYLADMRPEGDLTKTAEESDLPETQENEVIKAEIKKGVIDTLTSKGINVENVIIHNTIEKKSEELEGTKMTLKGKVALVAAVVMGVILAFQAIGFFTGKKGKDADPSKYLKTGDGKSMLVESGNEPVPIDRGVKAITGGEWSLAGGSAEDPVDNRESVATAEGEMDKRLLEMKILVEKQKLKKLEEEEAKISKARQMLAEIRSELLLLESELKSVHQQVMSDSVADLPEGISAEDAEDPFASGDGLDGFRIGLTTEELEAMSELQKKEEARLKKSIADAEAEIAKTEASIANLDERIAHSDRVIERLRQKSAKVRARIAKFREAMGNMLKSVVS